MFSDFVKKKKQSKSKESSENKIDSNISNLHSEKTTDSFKKNQVNIVNYGILIAYMNGILKRSLEIFLEMLKILE